MPSLAGGFRTETAGYFDTKHAVVGEWIGQGPDRARRVVEAGLDDAQQAERLLEPGGPYERLLLVPRGHWTLALTDGPRGTDVGMLPRLVARELGCMGIRATCCVTPPYPARILEVFGPDGAPPLQSVRSIAASNDGGRWIFETTGDPLPFEEASTYEARRKSDRFTAERLFSYLLCLGVPLDGEPEWPQALLVEW